MLEASRLAAIENMRQENPWWQGTDNPAVSLFPYFDMQRRPYLKQLLALLDAKIRRAVILMGPRRVGKTVLLHHAIIDLIGGGEYRGRNVCYVSLDNPLYDSLQSLSEFMGVYEETTGVDYRREPCLFVFDEIQYFKDWERHLKSLVDMYPNLKFVASGSAAAALRRKSNESGAGRFTDLWLPPLTFYEYASLQRREAPFAPCCKPHGQDSAFLRVTSAPGKEGMSEINALFLHYLNFGGYPEIALVPEVRENPRRFLQNDVVDKVLSRDLPGLYGVQDTPELYSLFTMFAYNTAGEVSLEELSKKSGVAKNTVKKYIEYFDAAFLIKTVNRVDANARRFKRATAFKVYLTNPSIRAALFSPLTETDETALGALVETAVVSQWFHDANPNVYYARWPKGEVDIVRLNRMLEVDLALEVKWSDRYVDRPEELKPQLEFAARHGLKELSVTTKTFFGEKQESGLTLRYIPAALYCYVLGHNILHRN